jgi:hypothetical protein
MELERLFQSLISSRVSPAAAVVNDDSADLATESVVRGLGLPVELLVGQYRRIKFRFVWLARIQFYIHQLRVATRQNKHLYKMFVYLRGIKS